MHNSQPELRLLLMSV
ncbi:hypothetical protein YPPY25_1238, partial [Yersinia pestis PY-25]